MNDNDKLTIYRLVILFQLVIIVALGVVIADKSATIRSLLEQIKNARDEVFEREYH